MPHRKLAGFVRRKRVSFSVVQGECLGFWISITRDVAAPPGNATWIVPAQSGNPWCPHPGTAESSINSRHPAAGVAGGLGRGWSAVDGVHPRSVSYTHLTLPTKRIV